jgi:hypothetical protein
MTTLTELFAFIAEGPNGKEGVASVQVAADVWFPLVAQTREELELLRPLAVRLSETIKKPVILSHFTMRKDLDTIQ